MGQERGTELSHLSVSSLSKFWDPADKVFKIPEEMSPLEGNYYRTWDPYSDPEEVFAEFCEQPDDLSAFIDADGEELGRRNFMTNIKHVVEENVSLVRYLKNTFGWDLEAIRFDVSGAKEFDIKDEEVADLIKQYMNSFNRHAL